MQAVEEASPGRESKKPKASSSIKLKLVNTNMQVASVEGRKDDERQKNGDEKHKKKMENDARRRALRSRF